MHQNRPVGSKGYCIFAEWVDFAYWWSCIGKGLCLQPAQQACFEGGHKNILNITIGNTRGFQYSRKLFCDTPTALSDFRSVMIH